MRIDLVLSHLCLFKTRSQATKACQEGRVWVNGETVRPSREVAVGDRIRFRDLLGRREEEVEVLAVPQGSVSKVRAREMVRIVEKRAITDPWERTDEQDTTGDPS